MRSFIRRHSAHFRERLDDVAIAATFPSMDDRVRWFEVWAEYDGSYLLVLKCLKDGTMELFDPQTGKVDTTFETYEQAVNDLREDEYTLVDGRVPDEKDEA